AFKRIVNVPRRSIGSQTLASLVTAADAAKVPVGQAIFDKELLKKAVPKKTRELERFAELIESLRSRLGGFPIADLLVAVMEASGYLSELRRDATPDSRRRQEN